MSTRGGHLEAELDTLRAAYPQSVVVGCSTSGEVLDGQVLDESITVAVTQFEHTQLQEIALPFEPDTIRNSLADGLALQCEGETLRAVLVLAEGSKLDGSALARALADHLPLEVRVFGGIAGAEDPGGRTWVVSGGKVREGYIAAVCFYGPQLRIGCGGQAGWIPVGPERVVNRAEGKVVYELDGQPALSVYTNYLGDLADRQPDAGLMFPLRISRPGGGPEVVRTVVAVDHDAGTITFAGEIPQGSLVRLMCGNIDSVVDAAEMAGDRATAQWGTDPPEGDTLALVVSCMGRRAVLRNRTAEELEVLKDAVEATSQQVGFYSFGELASTPAVACELFNQTLTVALIGESSPRHVE